MTREAREPRRDERTKTGTETRRDETRWNEEREREREERKRERA